MEVSNKGNQAVSTEPASTLAYLAILAAVPVAGAIHAIHSALPDQTALAVRLIAVLGLAIIAGPAAVVWLSQSRRATPALLSLVVLAGVAMLLTGICLYGIWAYVTFPADFLIWSESDYVNDILKFRNGYPLFGPIPDQTSFNYQPGSQLLTYFLAKLVGMGDSIPVYRAVQVLYTVGAVLFATMSCKRLAAGTIPSGRRRELAWWPVLWMPVLFLAATNIKTNPFVQFLHNDALVQLICAAGFWLLVEYNATRNRRLLIWMALIPAVGFAVKQSAAIWAGLYVLYLYFFDRPILIGRIAGFAAAAAGGVVAIAAGAYAIWGYEYYYWVFKVLGNHGVDVLRSVQHAIDIWCYYAMALFAGAILLRGPNAARMAGPWLAAFCLLVVETYTSGVAWMLNHIGPGCLLVTVLFLVSLAKIWPSLWSRSLNPPAPVNWTAAGFRAAIVVAVLAGMHAIRVPVPVFDGDAARYTKAIEAEFAGLPAERVLLDLGSWVYWKENVNMKDRVATIGEQAYSQTGDFSATVDRLKSKHYDKILVRNLDSPDFWYDSFLLRKTTGIKKALMENYRVERVIPAVKFPEPKSEHTESQYLFTEISIFIPRTDGTAAGKGGPNP